MDSSNSDFLQNYNAVFEHHVECILRCRLILNEDMQLVSTFWKPSVLKNREKLKYSFKLPCCLAIGSLGCLALILTENVRFLMVSLVPTLIPIGETCKQFYLTRYYKSNFKKLINNMTEIYTLNHDIMDYFHKRDSSIKNANISNEFLPFLLQPGEQFLQIASVRLTHFLKQLQSCLLDISKLVPICDDPFSYFTDWNLDVQHFDNFVLIKSHYQKLTDYYHLMVSNFLSCIGLTLCVQLWKDKSCNFAELFNRTIPNICDVFEETLQEIRSEFNIVRFTLYDSECKAPVKQDPHKCLVLQKPIDDVLTNLQITFQMVQQLKTQKSLSSSELPKLSQNFEKIEAQFHQSCESLSMLTKTFYFLTKQEPKPNITPLSPPSPSKNNLVVNNIRHDDLPEELEDEEYNLSIHGSDDDEPNPILNEYVDQCSTEHLELMFVELKKKLKERRAKKNGGVIEEEVDVAVVPPPPPPVPPPRPSLTKDSDIPNSSVTMPAIDKKFLDSLKSVAQKFNRAEEVFGSDNSDEDDIVDVP